MHNKVKVRKGFPKLRRWFRIDLNHWKTIRRLIETVSLPLVFGTSVEKESLQLQDDTYRAPSQWNRYIFYNPVSIRNVQITVPALITYSPFGAPRQTANFRGPSPSTPQLPRRITCPVSRRLLNNSNSFGERLAGLRAAIWSMAQLAAPARAPARAGLKVSRGTDQPLEEPLRPHFGGPCARRGTAVREKITKVGGIFSASKIVVGRRARRGTHVEGGEPRGKIRKGNNWPHEILAFGNCSGGDVAWQHILLRNRFCDFLKKLLSRTQVRNKI